MQDRKLPIYQPQAKKIFINAELLGISQESLGVTGKRFSHKEHVPTLFTCVTSCWMKRNTCERTVWQ